MQAAPTTDPEVDAASLRTGLPWWLSRATPSLRYIVHARAFALASAIRLTLPDALGDDWLPAAIVHWLGAALLAANGCLAGWIFCVIGLALPQLFYLDQLTQPVFLLLCALAAIIAHVGPAESRRERLDVGLAFAVRLLLVGTYALAATHKMNRDFLSPAVSCANGGVRLLGELWSAPAISGLSTFAGWPVIFLAAEISLAALLVLRPAAGIVLGLAMHLPLTIVFCPVFVFTMASGWVATLTDGDLRHIGTTLRRRFKWIAACGLPPAVASLSRYPADRWSTDADWCIKEVTVWLALSSMAWAFADRRLCTSGSLPFGWLSAWRERPSMRSRVVGIALGVLWIANGATPYLGVQFQHTAAMLSNLRIDRGCWNSLVFPEAMRAHDPYIRIDRAAIGEDEERARERLYSGETLRGARKRWCRVHPRPIRVEGTFDGKSFAISDFCADDGWIFGSEMLPGFRAYQVNLERECPQACVH